MIKIFDKLKDILGIEGLRIEILIPAEISKSDESINGKLLFTTKSDKTIKSITIRLIEKYRRGKAEKTLIDEYTLSEIEMDLNVDITEELPAKLDFELPISLLKSDMDRYAEGNVVAKNLVKVAKKLKNVKSDYRVEVVAILSDLTLNSIAKQPISII